MNESAKYYLTILPHCYWLLQSQRIDTLLRPLLQKILAQDDELLSLTMTGNEVSVIVKGGETAANTLLNSVDPMDRAEIHSDGPYFAIQLDTADPGRDEAGILAPVTQLLAQKNIPILCLSTFSFNYLLCPENRKIEFNQLIATDPRFCSE